MFPTLHAAMKDLAPEVYFGGEEVPAYFHIKKVSPEDSVEILSQLEFIGGGSNTSGYIDEEGLHFHLPEEDAIKVDLSKEYVFVSQPECQGGETPTTWQMFMFLCEPVRKALFVGADRALLVEKTDETLRLCAVLDILWAHERFQHVQQSMMENAMARERGLALLMKAHEAGLGQDPTEMWEFWEAFHMLLMRGRLGLRVTEFLPEEPPR